MFHHCMPYNTIFTFYIAHDRPLYVDFSASGDTCAELRIEFNRLFHTLIRGLLIVIHNMIYKSTTDQRPDNSYILMIKPSMHFFKNFSHFVVLIFSHTSCVALQMAMSVCPPLWSRLKYLNYRKDLELSLINTVQPLLSSVSRTQ